MKEEEFVKEYPDERILVPIYFYINDEEDIIIDEEGIRDEFNEKLGDILEQTKLEDKDELQKIVAEKIRKDEKNKNN